MPHRTPNPTSHPLWLSVALAALLVLVGCSGGSDANESSSAAAAAPTDEPKAAPSGSQSELPPLPDAASAEGDLPRTYAGITLGDPPPADAETLDGAPPFYPEATQHLVRLSDSPKTNVALYVHDGAVFRIEWRVRDASLDRDRVVEAFTERLGPPEEPSEHLPTQHVYWNDGLVDGTTTITVFRIDDSEWFRVAFEDTGRVSELMGRK